MDFERNLFPVLMINALAYEQPQARERFFANSRCEMITALGFRVWSSEFFIIYFFYFFLL